MEIKISGKTRFENLLKQLFNSPLLDIEVIITNSRYALVGYFITSYPTRAHGIINNYLPKWRWLVVDIYRAAERRGKYPPLTTDTEVNSCFSIY